MDPCLLLNIDVRSWVPGTDMDDQIPMTSGVTVRFVSVPMTLSDFERQDTTSPAFPADVHTYAHFFIQFDQQRPHSAQQFM